MQKFKIFTAIVSTSFIISGTSFASDCSNYPNKRGIKIEISEGSSIPKIISTASVSPFSIDIDDVNDALDEAEIEAKAKITSYLKELVSSERKINEEVKKITITQGENRERQSNRLKTILTNLSQKSAEVLTGVIVLGDCHTPKREVRVSVGIKPETIQMATGLSSGIAKSIESRNATTQTDNKGASNKSLSKSGKPSNLRPTEGFSNTEELKKF